MLSKLNQAILTAAEKGYHVNTDGTMDFNGKKINQILLKFNRMQYFTFSIRDANGIRRTLKVARLMAYQKYGQEMFKEGIVVRHKNGISTDNSIENILIGTQSDNMFDIPKEIRKMKSSKSKKHNHFEIINDYKNGMNYAQLCEKYNIKSKGTISFIVKKSIENSK